MTTGRAKLAGVMGWPVGHSLSPLLHGYWLTTHAIDGAYVPLAVKPEDFAEGRPHAAEARLRRRQCHYPAQAGRPRRGR